MSMHEPNSNNHASFNGGARPNKPPQPPLFIPPGHVAFRLLCHASRIGGLIGKSGSIIKQLQQLTNSRIRVEDPPHSGDHRVISVVASPAVIKQIKLCAAAVNYGEENNGCAEIGGDGEEVWFDVSAAQEGVVRVFERVVQVAAEGDAVAGIGGVVSCRLLVSKFQGGAVIGKGGKVVEKIRKDTGCKIKVLAVEKSFSSLSSMEEIVEIEGLGLAVKKALVAVTNRLQEFPPPEETRTYPTRPLESDSLPVQTVDLPLQRSPILQPTPSNYTNHASAPILQPTPSNYTNHASAPKLQPMPSNYTNHASAPILQPTPSNYTNHASAPILQPMPSNYTNHASAPMLQPTPSNYTNHASAPVLQPTPSNYTNHASAPILQPTPSNYINRAWGGGTSSVSEKVSFMNSIIPQLEVVFKILCPNEQVGGIIGKGGSIVKAIQHETGASVSIGSNVADCDERLITVTAMESVESEYSPAQKATIVVFTRSMETGLVKGFRSDPKESLVSARVLVASNQVGCLLGKGGAIISEMRKVTGTSLRIIGGDQIPDCASENEEVLQITGELANVQDALHKVTGRLRDNMFSTKMLTGNRNRSSSRTENDAYGIVRNRPAFGSHQSLADSDNTNEHKSLTQSMDHLAISSNKDRLSMPSLLTSMTLSGVNRGNVTSTGGRLASVKSGAEIGSRSRSPVMANTMTVEIVVSDTAIGSIYGENNSDFAKLQQISGAKVLLQEPRPGTSQRTVVISGTPDETQAAQSLLQAFILSGS